MLTAVLITRSTPRRLRLPDMAVCKEMLQIYPLMWADMPVTVGDGMLVVTRASTAFVGLNGKNEIFSDIGVLKEE